MRELVFESCIGRIRLCERMEKLVSLSFTDHDLTTMSAGSSLLKNAMEQILSYLAGNRYNFDIPLCLEGTDFQKAVWQQLLDISYGTVRSYAEIAARSGHKNAYRAVGNAVHINPLPIIVPCHRVVRSDGKPGGYAWGTERKEVLLRLEAKHKLFEKRNPDIYV